MWKQDKVNALDQFLRTIDRLGLMPPWILTVEMKPRAYLNKLSAIEYEEPEKVYGVVIRIMSSEGIIMRIQIEDE